MMPNLALHYIHIQEAVYGIRPWLPGSYYEKFRERELELMQNRIPLEEYTRVVTLTWKSLISQKGMSFVPPGMFLGNASARAYNRYLQQSSVNLRIDREEEERNLVRSVEKAFFSIYIFNANNLSEHEFREQWRQMWSRVATEEYYLWAHYQDDEPLVFNTIRREILAAAIDALPHRFRTARIVLTYDEYLGLLQNYHSWLTTEKEKLHNSCRLNRSLNRMLYYAQE